MVDIIIFGAGQFAEVMTAYIQQDTQDKIIAYTVDKAYCKTNQFMGLPLVPWEEIEKFYPPDKVQILGPISYRNANKFRMERFLEGKERGYSFYTFIHPAAYIYSKKIGENVIILEGNTIQPFAEIGNNCILWSHNHVGHHSIIQDHVFLCGRVTIGGNTIVEEGLFLGGATAIGDNVTIGAWSILSRFTATTKSIPKDSILLSEKNRLLKNAAKRFAKKLLG